jgi:glycosyltransferase involved in cell wall biosynthesis
MSLVQKRVLRRASAVHALTAEEARQTSLIAPDTPCNIVPNGIDVTALNSQASDADMFPQLADKKVILFLGRLHEKKGLDILVKAISIVRNTHPNLALLIAGDSLDNYGDRVRGFVVDEGIGDITTFTGLLSRKAVADAYAVARVFALPSRSEGFPMAVLEALASGVPVVITPECYFPEVAESGAGVEVEGTAPAFAKAITQLLANDDQRSKMAENARALVSKRFTVGAIAARMTAMYESVMTN